MSEPAPNSNVKPQDLWLCLLLLLAVSAVFWPVRHFDFINFDDPSYLSKNPRVQAGLTASNVAWAFKTTFFENWHPLTWLSYMLDCQLFGVNAGAHHLVNLLLHALNTLLVYALFRHLTGARWRSAMVAALFGLHPLHVESVAWISERKDVLSTLFYLLSLRAYARYVAEPRRTSYLLAFSLFILGLAAKPMLVTLPFLLLILDFWPLRRVSVAIKVRRRISDTPSPKRPPPDLAGNLSAPSHSAFLRLAAEKLPFFAASLGSCVITSYAQQKGAAVAAVAALPLSARLANATVSYARYLMKMVWPTELSVFYPYPISWAGWQIGAALALVASITALTLALRRRRPYLAVGWLWFIGTLVPVIGIVQVGSQSMADRYTYFPLLGLFLAVVWGGAELFDRCGIPRVVQGIAGALAAGLCALLSAHQVHFWKNSVTLFQHALAVTQRNDLARGNLGVALADQGKLEEALGHFNAALAIDPMNDWAHRYIGTILLGRGKPVDAADHFREALRMRPEQPETRRGLGLALARQGKSAEALDYLKEASQSQPLDAEIHFHLATAYEGLKRPREAVSEYQEALRLRPDSVLALNNLAWIQATCDDPTVRNGAAAVMHAEKACELTSHQEAVLMGTLAAAYAEAARFPEAVTTATKAVALATTAGQSEVAAKNRELLGLYQAGKPVRVPR